MNTTLATANPLSTHDTTRIDDRIGAVRPLITPALPGMAAPAGQRQALSQNSRAAISRVLHGADDRRGRPCSIHDHAQAMDYACQLKAEADAAGRFADRDARVF
jgi:3-deoxy-7-phosphoheptulonate synthase